MINLKKTFISFLLFSCVMCSLVCQAQSESDGKETVAAGSFAESDIVLSENDFSLDDGDNAVGNSKGSSGISIFIRMIVVLIIVVLLIYLVFFFIKKKTNVVKSDDEYLRRAAYINIAPGKTVEVITLINKAYLIGVTEDNITLLGEIKDEELIKAMNITSDKKNNTKKPSNFSEVLDTFIVKGGKQKNVFDDSMLDIDNVAGRKNEDY